MSTWLVVWFVIAVVTTLVLIAIFAFLGWHGVLLGRTAKRMQQEVQPIAEDISRMTARQQDRISELQAKAPGRKGPSRRR